MATADTKRDPAKPVSTQEDLEDLLEEGLASGEARPVAESDWERLRQRAAAGIETRKSRAITSLEVVC